MPKQSRNYSFFGPKKQLFPALKYRFTGAPRSFFLTATTLYPGGIRSPRWKAETVDLDPILPSMIYTYL
jgi:hypothetical protein